MLLYNSFFQAYQYLLHEVHIECEAHIERQRCISSAVWHISSTAGAFYFDFNLCQVGLFFCPTGNWLTEVSAECIGIRFCRDRRPRRSVYKEFYTNRFVQSVCRKPCKGFISPTPSDNFHMLSSIRPDFREDMF